MTKREILTEEEIAKAIREAEIQKAVKMARADYNGSINGNTVALTEEERAEAIATYKEELDRTKGADVDQLFYSGYISEAKYYAEQMCKAKNLQELDNLKYTSLEQIIDALKCISRRDYNTPIQRTLWQACHMVKYHANKFYEIDTGDDEAALIGTLDFYNSLNELYLLKRRNIEAKTKNIGAVRKNRLKE